MTVYLLAHLAMAFAAIWWLSRCVPLASLAGLCSAFVCVILGPVALMAAAFCALASINEAQNEIDRRNEDRRGHDPEFYKHKHDRRHK